MPGSQSYTIGQLARLAGVPVSTVRFYERRHLLDPDFRTGSNYRHYSPSALEKLRFIRAAQASGFSLKNIHEMLGLTHADDPPCAEVSSLIEHRLQDVREKLRELKRVEKALNLALKSCCKGGLHWCNAIASLGGQHARKSENSKIRHSSLTLNQGSTSTLPVD